jgi:hypothetical protein
MKNCIFLFSLLASVALLKAQTVEIKCADNTSNCFTVDPETSYDYWASTTDGSLSGYTKKFEWSYSPNSNLDPLFPNSPYNYGVRWKNVPNSPTRSITVKVSWIKTGYQTIERTVTRNVTIKYIAPITSMNITGAITASPSNNSTISIPCGVQNLMASVFAPATDPTQSVVYNWTKPSGWSGASSTNSINLATDAGQSDGNFSLSYRRSDGNFTQYYAVNYTRPRVSNAIITAGDSWSPSDKPLCAGETRYLQGNTSPNATLFNWTVSGGTTIVSGQGSSLVGISGASNGQIILTANNACQVSQTRSMTIYAGSPQVSSSQVTVDGHANSYPNYNNGTSYISIQSSPSCQAYDWTIFGGTGTLYPNQPCSTCGGLVYVHCNSGSITTPGNLSVKIKSANRCGTGTDVILAFQKTSALYTMTSSNPATEGEVSFELQDDTALELLQYSKIFNANSPNNIQKHDHRQNKGSAKIQEKKISYDISNLPKGLYYLVLSFQGDMNFTESIIIE